MIGSLTGSRTVVGYFSFETNQYEKVTEFGGSAMWLADSTRFVFLLNNKVYLGDVNTKRVREIFSTGENEIRSVDISPDGKLLYFTISPRRATSGCWIWSNTTER